MNNSVIVSLRDIVVEFDGQRILDGLNLDIHDKEFVTLLGSSGCGKTTTLRLIAGFLEPTSGKVLLKGEDITGVPPYKRPVNTVFQKYALFPHLNVFENVAFGLRLKKMDEETIRRKVRDMLEVVGLKGFERRSIGQMSGGQQQRVAIARSLVNEPEILLLDEPLGALDLKLRKEMQLELKRLQREMNITFIYVTHDQVEALTMSTKIALFREGELVQVDKPLELYDNPCDLYTADFIGNPSINFVEASGTAGASGLSVDGVMGRLEFSREDMTPEAPASGDLKLVLGIRPEQITISREKTDAAQVEARVYAGMPAGSETLVSVRVGEKLITVKELGSTHYAGDETVYLSYPPKKVNVFDASTKRLIKYSR